MSEYQALLCAKNGDSTAFEILYRLHHKNIAGRCRQKLANPADLEDAVQEVVMRLFRKLHSFRGVPDNESETLKMFASWLFRLTTFTVQSMERKRRCRIPSEGELPVPCINNRERESGFSPLTAGYERFASGQMGILDRMTLSQAYSSMPAERQMCFRMHVLEGYSTADISRAGGITRGKVQRHRSAAIRDLRLAVAR